MRASEQLNDLFRGNPVEYESKYWGSVARRRYCVLDIAIGRSKKFKLIHYTNHGFLIENRKDAYEIKVMDDWNVAIERYGKVIIMPISDVIKIIDGKANKVLYSSFKNMEDVAG